MLLIFTMKQKAMPKILTIDDIEDNLTIQSVILSRYIPDSVVITAKSGKEGIKKAIKELPDVILLDLMMPEMDGFEVCKKLKGSKITRSIPVIMLTGMKVDTVDRVKGLDAGADSFLTKPVEAIELVAQVNVMLRIKTAEDLLRAEKDQLERLVKKRTKSLQILSHCNRALVHARSELEFIQDICRIVVEEGQYKMAWVGFVRNAENKTVYPIAYWGDRECYETVTGVKMTWAEEGIGLGPVGRAIRTGDCCIVNDIRNAPFFKEWREETIRQGSASVIALPLHIDGEAVGVVNIYGDDTEQFGENEAEVLKELATDLAHGIKTFRLQVEWTVAASALKNSEEQYRSLFNGVPVGIFRATAAGKIIDANPELLNILGYASIKELSVVDSFRDFFADDEVKRLFSEVEASGLVNSFETRIKNSVGNALWAMLKINPALDEKGRVQYVEGTVEDITHRKRAEEHIHSLTQELIKAQEDERSRIARDLHDHVAQNLGALKITCNSILFNELENPDELKDQLTYFSDVLSDSIESVRDIAYNLRPPNLDQLGLIVTIAQYCDDFMDKSDIAVDFFSAGLEKMKIDFDTEINLYRLVQEALSNIKKHSKARSVTVRMVASSPDIIVRIEDDGVGFNVDERMIEASNEKRMGLKSMEERVSLLNGNMTIKSRVGAGTQVVIKVRYLPDVYDSEEAERLDNIDALVKSL